MGKYFTMAIDGSGVYTFDEEPLRDDVKNKQKRQNDLESKCQEAKLVCSNGFCLSVSTEWLKNEDGRSKQDCEQKALKRLLKNLKKDFSRLQI